MRRLILAVLTSAAMAGAGFAAPAPPSGVTGAVEDVATGWGGELIGGEADPSTLLSIPLGAVMEGRTSSESMDIEATDAPPPPEPEEPAPSPPSPPARAGATDTVAPLTVQARRIAAAEQTVEKCTTGPAMWRVTNGVTVMWIMGTPDQMPMNTLWDSTCLEKRMNAARVVIAPAIPAIQVIDPIARANTELRASDKTLADRLPSALMERLRKRIVFNDLRARWELDGARRGIVHPRSPARCITTTCPPMATTTLQVVQDAPNEFSPTIVVAERLARDFNLPGRLGNPAAAKAADIAGRGNMLIGRPKNSELDFLNLTYLNAPPEDLQQACLKKVLDTLDTNSTGLLRLDQIDAWARGDLDNAMRRLNPITACTYGEDSVRFWSALVAQYMQLIERNMSQPGLIMAVIEYDPLFIKNGIMDRMREKGWTITRPEEL